MIDAPQQLVDAILAFNRFVILYFLSLNATYLCFFVLSLASVLHFVRRTFFSDYERLRGSALTWPVSIIVPAHNEERSIVETIRSLQMLRYNEVEIIVVNDGSTDETLRRVIAAFDLRRSDRIYRRSLETARVRGVYTSLEYPGLVLVDKEKGGKADSLNCGINVSRYPLFCSIDADSIIEDNALLRVVKPFMDHPEETVASGGIVRIVNDCTVRDGHVAEVRLARGILPAMQTVEYLRSFLTGRVGWSALHSLLIISGAFGVYKKQEVIEIGGYSTDSETEDLDLVVRLHRHLRRRKRKYRVVFVPDPVCWTEVPSSLRVLRQQRNRWHRGLIRCLWQNRGMCFNPRYGNVGMFAVPYFITFELFGPIIEILGYVAVGLAFLVGILNLQFALLFLAVSILFGMMLSVLAVLLEELTFRRYPKWMDLVRLMFYALLENLGYRQLLSLYKIKSFFDVVLRRRAWGRMERTGFGEHRVQIPSETGS